MKTYNTISNALNLAKIDHGDPINWETSQQGNMDYVKTYILPYLKNADTSKSLGEISGSLEYKDLAGNSINTLMEGAISLDPLTVVLPNGALFFEYSGVINLDVNGIKAPNVVGRDVFNIVPASTENSDICRSSGNPICVFMTPENCESGNGMNVDACANKLLTDGKMDY